MYDIINNSRNTTLDDLTVDLNCNMNAHVIYIIKQVVSIHVFFISDKLHNETLEMWCNINLI